MPKPTTIKKTELTTYKRGGAIINIPKTGRKVVKPTDGTGPKNKK